MKGDDVYLSHILEAIDLIEAYTEGIERGEFLEDTEKQDAVVKRLEVIGEAAKNLSDETRGAHNDVPWADITGMRDILTHRYFGIDLDAVWDTVQEDLPELKNALS